jgi:hypothetical protein
MKSLIITISTYGLIIGMYGKNEVCLDPQKSVVEYLFLESMTECPDVCLN